MLDIDDLEHRHTVIFPSAKAFAVDDVLNFLASSVKHDIHSQPLERLPQFPGKWGQAATDIQAEIENKTELNVDLEQGPKVIPQPSELTWLNHETPEYIKKEFIEYKTYLTDRLLKAVKQGRFELWNWTVDKVVEPPGSDDGQVDHGRGYRTPLWWAKMASILKADLVSFCSTEKIRVVFENDAAINNMESKDPSEKLAVTVSNKISGGKFSGPPGKIPNVAIGKLAVKVAWEIECATGQPPDATAVIDKLQKLATMPEKEKWLEKPTATGVLWTSRVTLKSNDYGIPACTKTLQRWRNSYKNTIIKDTKETL